MLHHPNMQLIPHTQISLLESLSEKIINLYLQIEYISQIIKYGIVRGRYKIVYTIEVIIIYPLNIIGEKSFLKVLYIPTVG